MRNRVVAVCLAVAVLALAPTAASAGWKVFGAVAFIAPLADPTDVSGVGNAIEASEEFGFNVGFEWRFVNRLALEVDGTWASTDIEDSTGTLGDVDFAPIAANLNFHFFPDKFFDLYIGGGFAYVNVGDINLSGGGTAGTENDTAWDVQIGVDLNLGDHFAIVLGIRWYDLNIEASGGGGEIGVDPLVSRAGVGWRW